MVEKSDMHKYSGESDIYQKLNKILTYLIFLNVTIYILAMFTYGEKFLFSEYVLSYIGGTKTVTAIPNTTSWLIFSFGMILCGMLCFYICSLLSGNDVIEHKKLKRYLFFICGIGYLIFLMPYNINNNIHVTGAALVFSMLWMYANILIGELNQRIEHYKILLYHLILQGTVFPYAFLYFIHSPSQKQVQKFAVLGLMIALKLASSQSVKVLQKSME